MAYTSLGLASSLQPVAVIMVYLHLSSSMTFLCDLPVHFWECIPCTEKINKLLGQARHGEEELCP